MKIPQLPEVNWCQLYSKLLEAVDHGGFNVEGAGEGYFVLTPKAQVQVPVAYRYRDGSRWGYCDRKPVDPDITGQALYSAPPAQGIETHADYCERMRKECAQEADGSVESVVYASHKNLSAQGIDMGKFRALAQGWIDHAAHGPRDDALAAYDQCGGELLALIDQRDAAPGVGNG